MLNSTDNTPYEKIGDEVRSLADEVPFDIPDSWEWVRLGSAFAIEMGQSPAGNTVSGNCSGTEFHQGKVFFGEKYIKASDQYTSSPTKFAPENSVLLCVRAPVGKVNITDRELCIGRGLCAIIPLAGMPLLFAYYLLTAYENIFVKQATGTTFVAITAETVKNQLIPMPPLAEQQRIADLIEKLIPYVDEYGKAESAVDQLNTNFPEALKKSILQEAVQGKLVPQDPSDEPAEALLERIRAEKQRLIKEGKIKKDKHESVIFRRDNSHYEKLNGTERCIDDELPFEIPDTWIWTRLNTLGYTQTGNTPSTAHPEYRGDYIPFITPGDIADGSIDYTNQGLSDVGKKVARVCPADSILQVCIGGSIGKAALSISEVAFNQQINAITPIVVSSKYVFAVLTSFMFLSAMKESAGGTATPILNRSLWNKMYIPVPPLAEQNRIVQRIDELFPLAKGL